MKPIEIDLTILGVAIATYLTRLPAILAGRSLRVTSRLKRGLSYIPIGVFAGMIAPAMVNGSLSHAGVSLPFAGASIIAIAIAASTKSPLWTMLAGVVSIALLRLFL